MAADLLDERWRRIAFDDDGGHPIVRRYRNKPDWAAMSKQELRDLAVTLGETPSTKATVLDLVQVIVRASIPEEYDTVGTAEAAYILDVERPRIGRWLSKGEMPMPVVWPAAGPQWRRSDIEAMVEEVRSRKRAPAVA